MYKVVYAQVGEFDVKMERGLVHLTLKIVDLEFILQQRNDFQVVKMEPMQCLHLVHPALCMQNHSLIHPMNVEKM